MKKLKFIPVLAVAALLSACGSNGVSVKAPKFAKMGEEVSFEKFDEEINKRFDELDFLKEDLLNSKTLVGKGSSLVSEKMTRGKKTITESTMKDSDEAKYELDMKNYIAKMSGESKEEVINKSNSTNSKSTSNDKGVYYVQEAEYEGQKYLANVDSANKLVELMMPLSETVKAETYLDQIGKQSITQSVQLPSLKYLLSIMATWTEEEFEGYKFYQNGNTFTYTYSYEETNEQKDADDNLALTYTTKVEEKCQYVLEGSHVKFAKSSEELQKVEFAVDYTSDPSILAKAGDVYEEIYNVYREAEAKDAKVSLKAAKTDGFNFVIA